MCMVEFRVMVDEGDFGISGYEASESINDETFDELDNDEEYSNGEYEEYYDEEIEVPEGMTEEEFDAWFFGLDTEE